MKGIRWAQAAVTRNPNNLAPHSLARAQHQPHDTLKQPFLPLSTEQGTNKHLFMTYMFGDGLATLCRQTDCVSGSAAGEHSSSVYRLHLPNIGLVYVVSRSLSVNGEVHPAPPRTPPPSISRAFHCGKNAKQREPGSFCTVDTVGVQSGGAE